MEDRRGAYKVLIGNADGKRSLGRPRRRRDKNIKLIFKKYNRGMGVDWNDLAYDTEKWRALVKAVTNIGFHKMRRISWLTKQLLPQGLCSMELVGWLDG
jgi:hypothetical protein